MSDQPLRHSAHLAVAFAAGWAAGRHHLVTTWEDEPLDPVGEEQDEQHEDDDDQQGREGDHAPIVPCRADWHA